MSSYSCNFNKATIEKLNNSFTDEGVVYLQEEVSKKWDDCLNGELGLPFLVCIDTTNLVGKCRYLTIDSFLRNLSCVNFEFDPKKDMEHIKLDEAPIGVWIKASEVSHYDFSYLNGVDVLLRKHDDYYGCEEKRLNVTMDYTNYIIGFLYNGNVCISSSDEDNIPLDSCDYDIMVIKLDTNK